MKIFAARTTPLRSLSRRTNSSTSARCAAIDPDLEGADLDDHLIVDRQPLARLADAAELAGALERLGQPRLHDQRQPVGPLRALEILDRARRTA